MQKCQNNSNNTKANAICFMVDNNYCPALGTMIINILECNRDIDAKFVVFEPDLTKEAKDTLKKITPNIRFIHYTFEDWQKEHNINLSLNDKGIKRYSYLAFSKHKIFELLSEYKSVLFLDVDMLVRGDISELFNIHGVAVGGGLNFLQCLSKCHPNIEKIVDLSCISHDCDSSLKII